MTTEIAILNKQAVALAADSAVTVGRRRVWKTANKLFSLGPHNDIAIMMYGAGDFVGFPWETVVKTFRANVGNRQFATVRECADAFSNYIRSSTFRNTFQERLSSALVFVRQVERVKRSLKSHYQSSMEFRSDLEACLGVHIAAVEKRPIVVSDCNQDAFTKTFATDIHQIVKEEFEQHITKKLLSKIVNFMYESFRRKITSSYETGIVIAGFGKNEFFPALITLVVDGRWENATRLWENDGYSHDINDPRQSEATVIPFGQDDIAILFLEGIARSHVRWLYQAVRTILKDKSERICRNYILDEEERLVEIKLQEKDNQEFMKGLEKEFDKYRDETIVQKIMGVVSSLPKEEMAAMAEALVELTSLRRKMDSQLESVGGPTDVAVISKGDGLIWIKRKHYFDIDLNGDFSTRKKARVNDGGQDGIDIESARSEKK